VIDYEKDLASKRKKIIKTFLEIRKFKEQTQRKISDLHYHGNTHKTDKGKAEALDNFFASTFTHENTTNLNALKQEPEFQMDNIRITSDMVKKRLLALYANKGHGPGLIHPRLLKELANKLCEH
jgi:hypothetical protein